MIKPLTITHPINFKAHHANLIEQSDEIRNSLGYYNHTTCFFRYNNHDDNTDYFVITYYRTTVPKEVQIIVGQALFLREKFVNNIEMPYTDEIYYYD
jgi:hypothetical protein